MRYNKRVIALCMLLVQGVSVFWPSMAYALTNGPSQPESSEFQPASITELVDPFSGDFSYNIPLLDVDGYPVNIAYNSGGSMDDEASWVGFGWNINPGSVTRVMKGLPDDFNGTDKIKKEYNIRPDITAGVSFNVSTEIFGLDFLGANASADIFYNNHRGLGVEIGAGITASVSTAKDVSGPFTTGLALGGGLGIKSNSQTGADFNFSANMSIGLGGKEGAAGSLGLRFGGSLNSRAGMKSTTLGTSFNTSKSESKMHATARKITSAAKGEKFLKAGSSSSSMSLGSATSTYGQAFNPTITMPLKNESFSVSPMAGPEFWGFNAPTIQLTGHYTQQKLVASSKEFPAYGFLHSNEGRANQNALMDFNREKDVPYMENTPTIAVPYVTPDLFTATSHLGTSQFKAFSNSSGVFFDNLETNTSDAFSLGVEFGIGGGVKGGADLGANGSSTVTQKWNINNDFLPYGDFSKANFPGGEDAYFKLVGEKSSINKGYLNKIADKEPVKIKTDQVDDQAKAFSTLVSNTRSYDVSSKIAKNRREPRGEFFAPMTADQAKNFGLDKKIKSYYPVTLESPLACNNGGFGTFSAVERVSGNHKAHHLSQMTVHKADGMRLVYGIPVYNNEQTDVTFNVGGSVDAKNLVNYSDQENSTNNQSGLEYYFSKETVPAYATSFLLSGICSPDYVDVTGNGITDDDLGTAIKFNYSMVNSAYRWRTPIAKNDDFSSRTNYGNYNAGYKSQSNDNKASISYGNKELWYTNSIESKNMVAVFRLGARSDGYGFFPNGQLDQSSAQKKLERIDLYTKSELLLHPSNPTPVKSVHFEYDYSLFPGVPNNIANGGKLTLRSVYFTYGNNKSGEDNRYYFNYNESGPYRYQQYDKWGNFKDNSWNQSIAGINLPNNDYPYSVQDKTLADQGAQKWQLSQIELPSSGKINIEYESDDYAFVQNKRTMQMAKILGYGRLGDYGAQSSNDPDYRKSDKIYVQLPAASTNDRVYWDYFDGVDQLYFKTMVDLDDHGSNELVSGWAKIPDQNSVKVVAGHPDIAEITLEKRGDYHPVAAAAWQFMRQNIPKLAYPYEVDETLGPIAMVEALIAAIRNVGELLTPFETRGMRQNFASHVVPDQGYVRICNNYKKFGGGLRVKKILMDDNWQAMVGSANGRTTTTGMSFDYTRKYINHFGEEVTISSGVASYEPMAGSEENPFKQPISYQQKAHLTSSIYTVEEPLGESYFPAPSVGYSQVTIRNLDADGQPVTNGYTIKKFYTAKDFPTVVKRTDLSKTKYNQSSIFGLFNLDNANSVVLSQGFYVETNDMHGKPVSEETFDGNAKMIAGSYYHYKSSGTEQLALDNNALTLQPDGTVKNDVVGEEFEMFHDMREQITDNSGVNLNINLDVLYFVLFVVPIPTFIPIVENTHCGYESAATIKVVNKYAIADKVTTIENGSTLVSENMLWDALTGQVLLTKTQNGFNDPVYKFTLPAYMVDEYEKGMGAAYKNTGVLFSNITVNNGQVPAGVEGYLVPGDEVGISNSGSVVWAMKVPNTGIRLINKDGSMFSGTSNLVLLRSGRRNVLSASTYSIVSLKSPIRNGKIQIDQSTEVLSTSAGTFSDEWSAETANIRCTGEGRSLLKSSGTTIDTSKTKVNQVHKPVGDLKISRVKNAGIINLQQKADSVFNLKRQENFKGTRTIKQIMANKSLFSSTSRTAVTDPGGGGSGDGGNGDGGGVWQGTPCPSLSSFDITQTASSCNGGDGEMVTVTYNGLAGTFPPDKQAVFYFAVNCNSGNAQPTAIIINPSILQAHQCIPVPRGCEVTLLGMECIDYIDQGGTDCFDINDFSITHGGEATGCVTVAYVGTQAFPAGVSAFLEFSSSCLDGLHTGTITLDANHLTGTACNLELKGCSAAQLVNLYCTTGTCGEICSDIGNFLIEDVSNLEATCAKVSYICAQPFPSGVSVTFNFSLINNGVMETGSITLNATNLSQQICLAGRGQGVSSMILETWYCQSNGCCPVPINQRFNPYYTGLKGNWRGKQSFVYSVDRDPKTTSDNYPRLATNVRKGGIFKEFTSFYRVENGKFVRMEQNANGNPIDTKWIATSTVTKINPKGQELENKDALKRFSAAQFGFNDLMATAVGSNTRDHELAYDGFEDYGFYTSCISNNNPCKEEGHFSFSKAIKLDADGIKLSNTIAHTGNYSVWVRGGITDAYTERDVKTVVSEIEPPKYDFNGNGEMILKEGGVIEDFKPFIGKKYVVSGWVNGHCATSAEPENASLAKIIVQLHSDAFPSVNYSAYAVRSGPKVEGWIRLQTTFEIPAEYSNVPDLKVRIILWPGEQDAYFDDVRIHPYDGNMKSFAYDYKTSRLMAELDENNYATFFEYSDEGQLLRNKKETEKGIVTLKETRSKVRSNPH